MNSCIRALLLSAACITTAYAQPGNGNGYEGVTYTYDVNVEMLGIQTEPVTISGNLTVGSSCSAAFCAGYGKVDLRNSIDGTYFTQVPSGDGQPPFLDPKDGDTLNFVADPPWGRSGTAISVALTEQSGSKMITYTCGQSGVSCPLETMTLVSMTNAPEINWSLGGGAITLLLCGLVMGAELKSRPVKARRITTR